MSRPTATRTDSALALASLGLSQTAIARRLEVSVPTVHHWVSGSKRPTEATRVRIEEIFPTVKVSGWEIRPRRGKAKTSAPTTHTDVAPTSTAPPSAPPPSPIQPRRSKMANETADRLQEEVEKVLEEINDPLVPTTPHERAKCLAALGPTLKHIAQIQGQYDLGRRILSLPAWHQIVGILEKALGPFPDAAAAAAAALRRIDEELQ